MKKLLLLLTAMLVLYVANAQQGKQASPGEYVPNRVIVKFKAGQSAEALARFKDDLKNEIQNKKTTALKLIDAELWEFSKGSVPEVVAKWKNDPRIKYIEPDYIVRASVMPNDPDYASLWGMAKIQAPAAWDITTGTNVLVGVIDAGVDYNHPDLAANIWTNPGEIAGNGIDDDNNGYVDDVHGYDFYHNDGDPMDDNGHGTHVAGTIAAVGDNGVGVTGVNWSARIMCLKFIGPHGSGSTSAAILAVEYATRMGAQLTNNSYGGDSYSQGLYDAIKAAGAASRLFVAAAGNSNKNIDIYKAYPASYDLDNIIAVAATTQTDLRASYSSYGATSVDLGAPGSNIKSTTLNGKYVYLSGTSMATPHVAGVAALLYSLHPAFSYEDVKEIIMASVDTVASLKGITVTGGRLNAYKAVTQTWASLMPPAIAVSQTEFAVTLDQDASTIDTLSISNQAGSRRLIWNITDSACSWLVVKKLSGNIVGGGTNQVQLAINAAGLIPGNYQCSFNISSNDPDNPVIQMVVNLEVNFLPPPVAAVTPGSMLLKVNTGESSTGTLTIYNNAATGSRNLHWSAMLQGQDIGWLGINTDTGIVAAQDSQAIEVTANSAGLLIGLHQATIEITSNDSVHPVIQIPVVLSVKNRAYVNVNATGAGNGTGWADAFTSLQPALAAANTGIINEIWVAKGTYQPAAGQSFVMVEGTSIYGGFAGTESSLEQRNWKANITILQGNNNTVVQNLNNGLTAAAVLDGFTITGGNGPLAGGMYNNNVSPTIRNCIFSGNTANSGGGMFIDNGTPTISNCIFRNNTANNSGGGLHNGSNATISNCLFYGNTAGLSGADVYNWIGNASFRNVTLVNNSLASSFYAFGYTFWYNSIIWGSISGTGYAAANCLIEGNSDTGNGNLDATGITTDAIFQNAANSNYTLKYSSPCVGKGDNSFVIGATDLGGNLRVFNGIVDIGAYESVFTGILHVNDDAVFAGDGSTWGSALSSLTEALSIAANDTAIKQIWVAAGTYQPASGQSFIMVPGVEIYGGFAGTETALQQRNWKTNTTILQGNAANVVRNYYNGLSYTAVLDGFTITGGNAPSGGGITNENVSPTIRNCIFYNNHAGVYGGGMFNYLASPLVQNCLFYGNTAGTSGGEICNYSGNGDFINVTVASSAYNAFFAYGYTFWYNSIVWGGIDGTGYTATNSLIKGSSNTGNGNLDATGLADFEIFKNPAGNDHTLKPGSPCINKGTNAWVIDSTDLNGNKRIMHEIIDIGAYEYGLPIPDANGIMYVNSTAAPGGSGNSWTSPLSILTDALNIATVDTTIKQIWVAAGTYQPASGQSFTMVKNVKIYGGFAGTETALEQRNWKTNTTILKGNNASVVRNANNGLTATAVLDGFTITGGNASRGGGMANEHVSPAINNCIFYNNQADIYGGGLYNLNASVTVQNTLFYGNMAGTSGAEVGNYSGNGSFKNVTVVNNAANAFFAFGYTFWYNSIVWGGIDGTAYAATNSLFKGNSSTANGNIDATGLTDIAIFNNPAGNDYTLKPNSPCVNTGSNDWVVGNTDLNGNDRIINNTVDIGAYETLPLPVTASLQADTAICRQSYSLVTFRGAGGIAPYSFGYSFNGGLAQMVTTQTGDTVSVEIPSGSSGVVTYRLFYASDYFGNTASVDSTIAITIQPLHTYYQDTDGDGFGNAGISISNCSTLPPAGYVTDSTDCNDTQLLYADNDGDGFGGSTPAACGVANNTDCDDADAAINPLTVWVVDADGDGAYTGSPVAQCASPGAGYVVFTAQQPGDCDDANANVYPKTWYRDVDRDSYGNTAITLVACTKPAGYVARKNDCNDSVNTVNPGATEICDGIDNNCNGTIDEGFVKTSYYRDADGDGYGNPAMLLRSCSVPAGYVTNKLDCNDANAAIRPGAIDICDGIDNDCDGQVDEDCRNISIADASVTEGNAGQKAINFAVVLNKVNNAQTTTVSYTTQDGTATAGSDYAARSGTISFLPGVKKVVVQVAINGDRIVEPDETFNLVLSNPVNATIADGTGSGTIIDNDNTNLTSATAGTLSRSVLLSPNPASVKVRVSLSGYSGKVILLLSTKEGKLLREDKLQLSVSKMAQQQEIDLSKYAAGIYLLTIIDEAGNRQTGKLLITR